MALIVHNEAVFLSAGIPDPSKKHFIREADTAAVAGAMRALLFVCLGRRRIVWGGHPAITPMIWTFASALQVQYEKCVTLYQSAVFSDRFPKENARFKNIVITEAKEDIPESLRHMRLRMFSEHKFSAAVFMGGMAGIFDEYHLLMDRTPMTKPIPVMSTGGAAQELGRQLKIDNEQELDYVEFLYRELEIDPRQPRTALP